MPPPYLQGDAAILRYLDKLPEPIDISDTPDLLPPLALYAALRPGRDTRVTHAAFLRQKESDRLTAVSAVLNALCLLYTSTCHGVYHTILSAGVQLLFLRGIF